MSEDGDYAIGQINETMSNMYLRQQETVQQLESIDQRLYYIVNALERIAYALENRQ
ncbi:MAG TPA: hypothetical protein VGS21_00125 [Acidimicrobiales bacterium]|nr:hypothetical protein [Acidimicrobiales bacterium]